MLPIAALFAVLLVGAGQPGLADKVKPPTTPTPEKIVFQRVAKVGSARYWQAFTMNSDGSGQTQITFSKRDHNFPQWSPDLDAGAAGYQGKIAFASNGLWVMNTNGSTETQLSAVGGTKVGSPAWSPDGLYIAFGVYDDQATGGVWVYGPFGDPSAQAACVLAAGDGFLGASYVTWSPDLDLAAAGYQGALVIGSTTGPEGQGTYTLAADIGLAGDLAIAGAPALLSDAIHGASVVRTPSGDLRLAARPWGVERIVAADVVFEPSAGAFSLGPLHFLTLEGTKSGVARWSWDGTRLAHENRVGVPVTLSEVYVIAVPAVLGESVSAVRLTTAKLDVNPSWSPPVF